MLQAIGCERTLAFSWRKPNSVVAISAVVYEYCGGTRDHIVRVASLRRATRSGGADHAVDVRCR